MHIPDAKFTERAGSGVALSAIVIKGSSVEQ